MKIAFDITETCSATPTGCGHFAQSVVQAMIEMKSKHGWDDSYRLHYRSSHRKVSGLGFCPPGYALKPLHRYIPFNSSGAEIIHGFATHAPRLGRARRVVTLFDVFSVLDDSAEWQRSRSRRRKMAQYRSLARTCDMIITISEVTKRDFLEHFSYPEDRVRVVHGGVDRRFNLDARKQVEPLRQRYDLPENYFLYVGAPVPRKNVPRLIDAYAASAAGGDINLVLAGGVNAEAERLISDVRERGLADRVNFIGYVPDSDLPALYAGSKAFLFPTLYEGFGMPVLEAMACGVPVLIGNRGAAPEVAGGHAVEVDPFDSAAIAEGIERVIGISASELRLAREHAVRFTWERCALETRAAYRWLLDGGN